MAAAASPAWRCTSTSTSRPCFRSTSDRSDVDLKQGREVLVEVNLHAGEAAAAIWTNDLTYDYVKENAEYST